MQNYSSFIDHKTQEESRVLVSSNRCHYHVWIKEGEISIVGPGVAAEFQAEDYNLSSEIDNEDLAILAILLFENGVLE